MVTSVTVGLPTVSVPVLSKATTSKRAASSKCAPPLNKTPRRAPLAIAERIAAGVLMISAQGEATTMTVIARYAASRRATPKRSGGKIANSSMKPITPSAYTCSNLSRKRSVGAFSLCASSTNLISLAIVDSWASLVTFTSRLPD